MVTRHLLTGISTAIRLLDIFHHADVYLQMKNNLTDSTDISQNWTSLLIHA